VGYEGLRDFDFRAQHFFPLIGVFFAAVIAVDLDLLGQHRHGREGIGFPKHNAVLVAEIRFVMKAAVLADHDPEVVGAVEHGESTRLLHFQEIARDYMPDSRLGVVKNLSNSAGRVTELPSVALDLWVNGVSLGYLLSSGGTKFCAGRGSLRAGTNFIATGDSHV